MSRNPIVQHFIEEAEASLKAGKNAARRGMAYQAVAHYSFASAFVKQAEYLIYTGMTISSRQDMDLATLGAEIQLAIASLRKMTRNGRKNPADSPADAADVIEDMLFE